MDNYEPVNRIFELKTKVHSKFKSRSLQQQRACDSPIWDEDEELGSVTNGRNTEEWGKSKYNLGDIKCSGCEITMLYHPGDVKRLSDKRAPRSETARLGNNAFKGFDW